jgi:hypothetical protein
MKKEEISVLRAVPMLVIAISTIILSIVLGIGKGISGEKAVCVAFVDMLFLLVFLFELEYERRTRLVEDRVATTFSRIAAGFAVCCAISVLFLVCPDFFMPVMLFPVIMCAVGNEFFGISTGMFLVALYAMVSESEPLEVVAYMFLVLLAGGLVKTFAERRLRKYASVILFFANVIVSLVFYFLAYGRPGGKEFLYALGIGLVTGPLACLLFIGIRKWMARGQVNHLADIISDDYFEVKKLEKNLPGEYAHAKKVSDIAIQVAERLGLDPGLCGAAGFYYRMGKWKGIGDGVGRAQDLDFPIELIHIISEYNGEQHKPSTPESAIIQMISSLTMRIDEENKDITRSTWDHEMLIYQTLNEYSSEGMYDECGLSMNQFLTVRECLAKEKSLQ